MTRLAALVLFLAGPAMAQTVHDCGWIARADAIVEPWENNIRSFAKGNVRLALLDTVEPAAGAFHVLIVSPPYNELGERQCKTLGLSENFGFAGADFASLNARYDPTIGLVFHMEVQRLGDGDFEPEVLVFTLNQASGAIHAELQ